jgi:hypothetical protein
LQQQHRAALQQGCQRRIARNCLYVKIVFQVFYRWAGYRRGTTTEIPSSPKNELFCT